MANKDTEGITVHGKDLDQYLYEKEVEEKTKSIHATRREETKAPARLSRDKPKYKTHASRAGKGRHLTTKEIEMEYKDVNSYGTNQKKVLAALLKIDAPMDLSDLAAQVTTVTHKNLSPLVSTIKSGLKDQGLILKQGGRGMCLQLGEQLREKTVEELDQIVKGYKRQPHKPAPKEEQVTPGPVPTSPSKAQDSPFSYPQIISEIGEAINNMPQNITIRFIVEIKG